ncbi:hypothetical protein HYX14_00605 [Candidatus Woesearchaeota archaeon]|nr:hypothetical protein [Candidatus Woesearchaeota archaeon]
MRWNKRWGKKAITVIMTSSILITFAIAVGTTVMGVGSAQVEERAQCAIDVDLHFLQIGGKEQLCYDAAKKEIDFTAENGVNIRIEGLLLNVIGSQKAESKDFTDAKIQKALSYVGKMPYDTAVSGEIKQLKVIPKVIFSDTEEICAEQAVTVEKVRSC